MPSPTAIASLADLANPLTCPRLVIKVGSSLLVDANGARRDWLAALVGEIAAARARGPAIIGVS
jgi:glutamate 5-kinase